MAAAGGALLSRCLPITNHVGLIAAALSPYLMLSAPLAVLLLVLARRWVLVTLAVGLTVAVVAVQLPGYLGATTPVGTSVGLRIASANLREGRADPDLFVLSVRDEVDVIALQELTPRAVERLSAAGLDAAFPYRWLDARNNSQGVGMWSRYPLADAKRLDGFTFAAVTARLRVAGVSIDPLVAVVHVAGPWPNPIDDWRRDMARLPTVMRDTAERAGDGCVIVAGDFNSTSDMRPFRELLKVGYQDAAEQSAAGLLPTFPAGKRLPPFLAIDHVLTRNCAATSVRTKEIRRSDHLAVVATVEVPRTPASG